MPPRDDLLNPISGEKPAGIDLRYDPTYDKIKEARREDDDAPQGEWERPRKLADWPQVIKLAGDAIATKSKDLQLAAWLTEAQLRREGYAGLAQGLSLMRGIVERFWDGCFPEVEDGDLELRAAPLEWVGIKLDVAARSVNLTRSGCNYFQYKEARAIGTEAEAAESSEKAAARQRAIDEGKLTPEEFEKLFAATPKPFYKQLVVDLAAASQELEALDAAGQEKFGGDAPSYRRLRDALAEVQAVAQQLLARKLELEPDPVQLEPTPAESLPASNGATEAPAMAAGALSAEPVSVTDASAHVVAAARFLRHADAANPTPYLLLRALRWGELRASGPEPDPKMLEAPPSTVRTQLRRLLLDAQWPQLLEGAEAVMGTPAGRGWLDLQRYVLTACGALGGAYEAVGAAVLAELRALLAAIPSLPDMSLMDDFPTANPETRTWLRDVVLAGSEASVDASGNGAERIAVVEPVARGGRGLLDRAMAEVRAGQPQRAIEMLMRQVEREKSARGRFLRHAEVASVMVEAGLVTVAQPILEQLLKDVEAHHLETWEAGDVVAQPMALLYKCLEKTDGDSSMRQDLYLRICRLDPMQAIGFAQQ